MLETLASRRVMKARAQERAVRLREWARTVAVDAAEAALQRDDSQVEGGEAIMRKAQRRMERLENVKRDTFSWRDFDHHELSRGIQRLGGGGTAVRIYFQLLSNLCYLVYMLALISLPTATLNSMGTGLSGSWNISAVGNLPIENPFELIEGINKNAEDGTIVTWGVTLLERARLQTTILNVCQGQHCKRDAVESSATVFWSILLVSSIVGLCLCMQIWSVQMQEYRLDAEAPDAERSEARRTVRLRGLPRSATEQQVREWLEHQTSSKAIQRIFVPKPACQGYEHANIGEAYVCYSTPTAKDRAMEHMVKRWDLRRGFKNLWQLKYEWKGRVAPWWFDPQWPEVSVDSHSPMPRDIMWSNLALSKYMRAAWNIGFLIVWGLVVSCEVGLLYLYLVANQSTMATLPEGLAFFVQLVVLNPLTFGAIAVVNVLTYILGWLEAPALETEYTRVMLWQSYIVNILLTPVLMVFACFPDIFPWHQAVYQLSTPQTVCYVVNFLVCTMFTSPLCTWFNITNRVSSRFWHDIVWPIWFELVPHCWKTVIFCGGHSSRLKQKHIDDTWAPPEFELSGRYVGALYIITVGLFASPGAPVAYCTTAVALTAQYYADRHWLMQHCAMPKHQGYSEVLQVPQLALRLISLMALSAIWIAYLWWTRCGDVYDSEEALARTDRMVFNIARWEDYGYFAIAPGVCVFMWLLYVCGCAAFTKLAHNFYKQKHSMRELLHGLYQTQHRIGLDQVDNHIFSPHKDYEGPSVAGSDPPWLPEAIGAATRSRASTLSDDADALAALSVEDLAVVRNTLGDLGVLKNAAEDEDLRFFEEAFARWEESMAVDQL